jgi:tRNA A-37 threonylcarbamoyl transferase component Bud32
MTITEKIRTHGVPTVQVVAAIRHRSWGPFYRGELITKDIPGARDLVSFMSGFGAHSARRTRAMRHEAARQAGKTVRFMHDRGIYHGDLNLKNLLIRTGHHREPEVYIIDFDRSKVRDSLTIQQRMQNILRLNRSAEKWKTRGLPIRYTDKARFFQAYARGDSDIVHTMRRYLKRVRVHTWWYRFGWRVDRLFNPSSD